MYIKDKYFKILLKSSTLKKWISGYNCSNTALTPVAEYDIISHQKKAELMTPVVHDLECIVEQEREVSWWAGGWVGGLGGWVGGQEGGPVGRREGGFGQRSREGGDSQVSSTTGTTWQPDAE